MCPPQRRPAAPENTAPDTGVSDCAATTHTTATGTAADLAAIAAAPQPARPRLINDFLAARQPLFGQLTRSICLRFRITPALHADDVRQIVAMTALAMVNEHLRGELGARRFEALLTVRARSKVRAHFDSASHTPLSEMTTVKRRLRKLGEKRRQLVAELGREPSADEVVRQWNTEARTRFSDPARQAMLATVTDLVDVLHHGDPARSSARCSPKPTAPIRFSATQRRPGSAGHWPTRRSSGPPPRSPRCSASGPARPAPRSPQSAASPGASSPTGTASPCQRRGTQRG